MAKPKVWDSHSIKAELHRRGMTLTRLAEMNDLSSGSFRHVWKRTHRKAEAAIAAFLGVSVEELFPNRYPIQTSTVLSSKYAGSGASPKSPNPMRSAA
jgi:Ner family transcriptional regulator